MGSRNGGRAGQDAAGGELPSANSLLEIQIDYYGMTRRWHVDGLSYGDSIARHTTQIHAEWSEISRVMTVSVSK